MTADADQIDRNLIALLRRDARASVSSLAEQLSVSRATVRARMQRLEQSGVVIGYTIKLKSESSPHPTRGVMLIEIEGGSTDRIIHELEAMPEVQVIHTTNGRWDLIVELGTGSLPKLDLVLRRIRLIAGIMRSETNLYLSSREIGRGGGAAA
ncbi:MAG: Lrp/AsnC family transcriptional regulator [Burkholderiaceae bacterium]